ncbi:gamma-glutamylaminecyclotransferase-like [Coregonus clupeaformis]|uniref:gamma-glutamylaminecyclotransferase-like n=1 Tax=Coregonus clupeaformis TaxID=59861 RepID=UPI001E1C9A82|nr:gamma-glutamylaminecyclotransferase-like [Coregonus clupeaformis]
MRGVRGAALLTLLSIYLPPVQMTSIFVYGTLKKGQPNYFRMLPDQGNGKAEFCGHARTVDGYPLVIAGKYNIPALLNRPGEGHRVHGEVYRVDDTMLSFLDTFEGCPTMYQRTSVQLELEDWKVEGREGSPASGSIMEAFLYSTTSYQPAWLQQTFYESYDAYGDHGLVYVNREDREFH